MSVIQLGSFVVVKLNLRTSNSPTKSNVTADDSYESDEEMIPWYHGIKKEECGTYKMNEFDQTVEQNTACNSQKSCSTDLDGLPSCNVSAEHLKQRGVRYADDTLFLNRDEERRKEFLLRRGPNYQSIWSKSYWRLRWRLWLLKTEKKLRVIAAEG